MSQAFVPSLSFSVSLGRERVFDKKKIGECIYVAVRNSDVMVCFHGFTRWIYTVQHFLLLTSVFIEEFGVKVVNPLLKMFVNLACKKCFFGHFSNVA